jgi:hypothetical protein
MADLGKEMNHDPSSLNRSSARNWQTPGDFPVIYYK